MYIDILNFCSRYIDIVIRRPSSLNGWISHGTSDPTFDKTHMSILEKYSQIDVHIYICKQA